MSVVRSAVTMLATSAAAACTWAAGTSSAAMTEYTSRSETEYGQATATSPAAWVWAMNPPAWRRAVLTWPPKSPPRRSAGTRVWQQASEAQLVCRRDWLPP